MTEENQRKKEATKKK